MIAQDPILFRAEPRDRGARGMIEPVRAKFDRDALQLLESVSEEQQLAFGVDGAALDTLGVPGVPDLETPVRRVDVEVTRAADDVARSLLANDERHRIEALSHVERGIDVLTHFSWGRHTRVPQAPQLAVGGRAL